MAQQENPLRPRWRGRSKRPFSDRELRLYGLRRIADFRAHRRGRARRLLRAGGRVLVLVWNGPALLLTGLTRLFGPDELAGSEPPPLLWKQADPFPDYLLVMVQTGLRRSLCAC